MSLGSLLLTQLPSTDGLLVLIFSSSRKCMYAGELQEATPPA